MRHPTHRQKCLFIAISTDGRVALAPLMLTMGMLLLVCGWLWTSYAQATQIVQYNDTVETNTDEMIAYSLRSALEEAALTGSLPETQNSQLYQLGGITELDGFVVDEVNRDIILVGFHSNAGFNLHLDDLVTALRNALADTMAPFCSIDPIPSEVQQVRKLIETPPPILDESMWLRAMEERLLRIRNVWRNQAVRVGGIPAHSHHARLMVDADYVLKKATLGLTELSGVESYLDRLLQPENYGISFLRANSVRSIRFWFHIQSYNPQDSARVPFPQFERSDLVVQLLDCPVVLLTEKQIFDEFGIAHPDAQKTDPFGEAYAADFTAQFATLQTQQPPFAALQELFKLNALVRAMVFTRSLQRVQFPTHSHNINYTHQLDKPMPESIRGYINHHSTFTSTRDDNGDEYNVLQFPIVYGGVDMSFPMTESQFFRRKHISLDQLKQRVLAARPDTIHRDSLPLDPAKRAPKRNSVSWNVK